MPSQQALLAALSKAEQQRYQSLRQPKARLRWLYSRGILRHLLAAKTGLPVAELEIIEAQHGKPQLPNSHWQFNVSHSGDHYLFAISHGIALGVDVEQINPNKRYQAIAARYFSAEEQALIAGSEDSAACFYRLWTAKEAITKAHGRGIGLGLERCQVVDAEYQQSVVDGVRYNLQRLRLNAEIATCLCWVGTHSTEIIGNEITDIIPS